MIFLSICVDVCVCGPSNLCHPLCSDKGTSQRPDDPDLFGGVHVWKLDPPQVHDPYSHLDLLCLCDHVQTGCGPAMRQIASWDCCHWWSERERKRPPRRKGERKRDAGRGVSFDCRVGVFCRLWGKRHCVFMYVCAGVWMGYFSLTLCKLPTHLSPTSHPCTYTLVMFQSCYLKNTDAENSLLGRGRQKADSGPKHSLHHNYLTLRKRHLFFFINPL